MIFNVPTIQDISWIRQALKGNSKRGCELSAANTVLWAKRYQTEVSLWNGELIYRSKRKDGSYSFCGNFKNTKDVKLLMGCFMDMARQNGQAVRLHCVTPEEWEKIDHAFPGQFEYILERDDYDYIYLVDKLASLSGKKLHGKRNHIHRFEENHPTWKYETITEDNEKECAQMAMNWCMNHCQDGLSEEVFEKIDESKIVVYAIKHRKELGLIGGALRVDEKIVAITLGEPLTKDTFVVHFEKAYSDIQGAYPMMNREFVRHELVNYQYVNREEDLGLEGLRKAKLSYYPEVLFEKGIVLEKSRN
ncbi:MAG: phosphatidylglycerol lysyltransferase domain-containing protein [Eubacteriales bacterium]|nr:phosphatidylglycerol lysyltransferase domain-containing protein [Eubacteriales bacterium]